MMLRRAIMSGVAKSGGDPYWDNVVALLHFDGDLTDEAGGIWSGTSVSYSSSPYVEFGSEFVGGGGSTIRRATRTLGALWNNVTAFTLEARVTQTSLAAAGEYPHFLCKRTSGEGSTDDFSLYVHGDYGNRLSMTLSTSATGGRVVLRSNKVLELGVPTHVAACYDGEEVRLYVDGVVELQSPVSGVALNRSNPLVIGTLGIVGDSSPHTWRGRIDEIRITRDVARYTEDFTPPTEPFPNY